MTHFSGHLNTCVKGGKNVCAAQIVEYQHLQQAEGDTEGLRRELDGRLERIRDLYEWGDKAKDDHLSESREIKGELTHLLPHPSSAPMCWACSGVSWRTWQRLGRRVQTSRRTGWRGICSMSSGPVTTRWLQLGPGLNSGLSSRSQNNVKKKVCLATPTGFEPAISALTGQCVKPLHHGAASH